MSALECPAIVAASEGDLRRRLDETARELDCVRAKNERLRALLALAQPTQPIIASAKEKRHSPGRAAESPLLSGIQLWDVEVL